MKKGTRRPPPTRSIADFAAKLGEQVTQRGGTVTAILDEDDNVVGSKIAPPPQRVWFEAKERHAWRPASPSEVSLASRPLPAARPRERQDSTGKRAHSSSRRSSERSGDSGDPDEPEPPHAGRLCECGCRESIAHLAPQARYVDDTHRKRARRSRARTEAAAPDESSAALLVIDRRNQLAALLKGSCQHTGPSGRSCGAEVVSRDPENGRWCVKCGHPRSPLTSPNGFREFDSLMRANGTLVRHAKLEREWRTRPSRSEAAVLRASRREYVDTEIVR